MRVGNTGNVELNDGSDKQDTLVSGQNIRTFNGISLLGSGDLGIVYDQIETDVEPSAESFSVGTLSVDHVIRPENTKRIVSVTSNSAPLIQLEGTGKFILAENSNYKYNIHCFSTPTLNDGSGFINSTGTWNGPGELHFGSPGEYFVIVACKPGASGVDEELTLDDVPLFLADFSAYDVVTSQEIKPINFDRSYNGTLINTNANLAKTELMFSSVPTISEKTGQAMCMYGDKIFQFYNNDVFNVLDLRGNVLATGTCESDHANTAFCSKTFNNATDICPIIYLGWWNNTNDVTAISINQNYVATTLKHYRFPTNDAGYYAGFVCDELNKVAYTLGYKNDTPGLHDFAYDTTNNVIICAWDMTTEAIDQTDGYYHMDLIKRFELPAMIIHQDQEFFDQKIWLTTGISGQYESHIYAIDPVSEKVTNDILLHNDLGMLDKEVEGIQFYKKDSMNYSMYVALRNGPFYKVDFYNGNCGDITFESTLPATPTIDGTYQLTCTVVNGTPTYNWVSMS